MAHRPHPKQATNNPADGPWVTCFRCGWVTSQIRMRYQYDFVGGSSPQNLNVYVCPRCYDGLAYQFKLLILPPDPPPLMNTYPEPYAVDETNWLTTESGSIIDTQLGEDLITSVPNPASPTVQGEDTVVEESAYYFLTGVDSLMFEWIDLIMVWGVDEFRWGVETGGDIIVTEAGDGNPLNYEPNP